MHYQEKYPATSHFKKVQYDHEVIMDFLRYLAKQGVGLDFPHTEMRNPSLIVDEYLKIDREAVEKERLAAILELSHALEPDYETEDE